MAHPLGIGRPNANCSVGEDGKRGKEKGGQNGKKGGEKDKVRRNESNGMFVSNGKES